MGYTLSLAINWLLARAIFFGVSSAKIKIMPVKQKVMAAMAFSPKREIVIWVTREAAAIFTRLFPSSKVVRRLSGLSLSRFINLPDFFVSANFEI